MHCTIFAKVDYIKFLFFYFFLFLEQCHSLAVSACHQYSRPLFNNNENLTLHFAKLIPSSYDMVIFAKLVHFNISKKLSIVSPSPNAEHLNQD